VAAVVGRGSAPAGAERREITGAIAP
jgi:hypothetical protein